jgi:hypothetical protein
MRSLSVRKPRAARTTVRLPRELYEEVQQLVSGGMVPAETVNELLVTAIRTYLKMLRRKRIDAEFAPMAEDSGYQQQAKLLLEEFAPSDWEAMALSGKEPAGA